MSTAKQKTVKGGMASFFSEYLDKSSASHQAAMEASTSAVPMTDLPSGTLQQQQSTDDPTELDQAKAATAKLGRVVEVNEDGQIVDKTELLSGGLNIIKSAKKKPVLGPTLPSATGEAAPATEEDGGFSVPISQRKATDSAAASASAAAAAAASAERYGGMSEAQRKRLMRERQSIELAKQMEEVESKKRAREEEELQASVKKVARRNDESKVEELKRLAAERRAARSAAAAATT